MDAIRLESVGDLSTIGVAEPACGPEEALVEVEAAGVCGSDVGAYRGKAAYGFLDHPRILGHEYVGTVVAVGERVENLDTGDRVVELPLSACGTCRPCRRGAENVCEDVRVTGFHHDGAFAERLTAPATRLHRIPEGLSTVRAVTIEPLAVAYRGAVEIGVIAPGERVLVLGPGPIGSLVALLAARAGAEVVLAGLPRDRPRLDRLEGVETVELSPDADPPAGFDVSVDATGSPEGPTTAITAARNGGRVVLLGIPPGPVTIDGTSTVRGEKQIHSSYSATAADFERVISLQAGSRSIPVEGLSTDYSPGESTAAFEAFADGDVIKPVFRFDGRADRRRG